MPTPTLPSPTNRQYDALARAMRRVLCIGMCVPCFALAASSSSPVSSTHDASSRTHAAKKRHDSLDHTGKPRKGRASYYGREFYRKKMADGTPMNPQSNAAASKSLPLGTKARVTNLQNGSSQVVEIKDRGPYVKGRIVDVSPKTADALGLKKDGTAPVEVKPLSVPPADGSAKAVNAN